MLVKLHSCGLAIANSPCLPLASLTSLCPQVSSLWLIYLSSPLIIVFSLLSFSRPLYLDSIFRGQISSSLLCICLLMCNFLHKFSPVGPVMTVTQDDISDEDVPPLIPPPCHTQVQVCLWWLHASMGANIESPRFSLWIQILWQRRNGWNSLVIIQPQKSHSRL